MDITEKNKIKELFKINEIIDKRREKQRKEQIEKNKRIEKIDREIKKRIKQEENKKKYNY